MAIPLDRVLRDLQGIVGLSMEKVTSTLEENIHVLDVSFTTLSRSTPALNALSYKAIIYALTTNYQQTNSLTETLGYLKDPGNRTKLYFVQDPKLGTLLVSNNYSSIQKAISKVLKIDIAQDVSTNIPLLLGKLSIAASIPIIKELNNLYSSYKQDITYKVEVNPVSKILGRGTVQVDLTAASASTAFKTAERNILKKISEYIISEEFRESIVSTDSIVEQIFNKTKSTSIVVESSSSKKVTSKSKVLEYKVPQLRTVDGRFYSINSLAELLKDKLAQTIQNNMGKGSARSILNYRTGRFAESVEVQKLVQGKDGIITAFYNYMKVPYQTFEPGFRQGSPKSRDPKLLIAKSIREIASEKISSRMKAVLV